MNFRARHNGRSAGRKVGMNKLETAYADYLQKLQLAGEVAGYAFESIKFRLAANTFYTPDFVVYSTTGEVEIHEVKGHWEDDARVKIKVFASLFPFRTLAVTRKKSEWQFEEITGA